MCYVFPPSQMVCYVSSHVGVLFDISHNKQTLLQGHSHCITTTAVSGNRRWVVTADTGPNSTLIVWDSHSGCVVVCGCVCMWVGVCACVHTNVHVHTVEPL